MHSQVWLHRSRALLHKNPASLCNLIPPHSLPARSVSSPGVRPSQARRISRSHLRASVATTDPVPTDSPDPPPNPPEDDKPSLRAKRISTKRAEKETKESLPLPRDLDIVWSHADLESSSSTSLPPEELIQDCLNNLLIALHPKTQHRATYATGAGPPIEPTLGLYCPIEGGDYIVDLTVRELARRSGADVVVLDACELAAGEMGIFGKANPINISNNPLHLSAPPPPPTRSQASKQAVDVFEDDNEPDMQGMLSSAQPVTLHLTSLVPSRSSRQVMLSPTPRGGSESQTKLFFDELVNMPIEPSSSATSNPSPVIQKVAPSPRIIYIRDFGMIAPSHSAWYGGLLAAVRARRQGPISRPSSPVSNPTTIILGITPSLVPSASSPVPSNPPVFPRMKSSSGVDLPADKSPKSEWDESPNAMKARGRRTKNRLAKWEKGTLNDELPYLPPASSVNGSGNSDSPNSGVVVIAGPSSSGGMFGGLPGALGSAIRERIGGSSASENAPAYFRTSVIVPTTRSLSQERISRVSRRRHLNELIIRMAIAAVGGEVDKEAIHSLSSVDAGEPSEDSLPTDTLSMDNQARMLKHWEDKVETWVTAKDIADRAVGRTVAANYSDASSISLDATPVSWTDISSAWATQLSSRDIRKTWIAESVGKAAKESDPEAEQDDEQTSEPKTETVEDLIEKLKQDQELDYHDERLLGCIVDPSTMPTTFSEVHLPPHTIDSIRTIVSLPLLHPDAFAQGILKQHSMTGALLFGPPGTGKTLVVRALARESGARMMIIKPSDVMDMFVGEGEKHVRSIFTLARRLSPCVVFIDEIDALFGARVSARESGGAMAHRSIITEFMQEMDGLRTSKDNNVIVIGATNRPFDLDDAVLRRLPRRLLVDLPGEKEREEILRILLRDETLAAEVDLNHLAKRTESFSGSDLKHLCVSAALDSVKETVDLPWRPSTPSEGAAVQESATSPAKSADSSATRVLTNKNFTKALSEITPSASESLSSLVDLRKWNEEFGEGRKERKQRMWGGRFGFTDKPESGSSGKVNTRL
ncbi:AAA-domain-containing protein [Sistotremastrum suecicum HHB10207 ss-3]|uniref:AAA-domain-containing protein n=1 Tax=Sistotremastrum suecicum HHB10207 ss-3 TaxID=1314776 RepID=A0A166ITY2_9AGAM|nr:AAA-domain-containing protein [Sistotremastrum suecicum HHB10207 ss-3]